MREERISLNDVSKRTLDLGYVGEENHTQVVIVCTSMFKKYPAATVTMVAKPPVGDLYPVTLTRDDNTVIWNVSPGDIAYAGSGQFQMTFTNGTEIIKREYGSYSVKPSLAANGEPPEPIQDWIESVNQAVQGKLDAPSTPGTDGQFLATDGEGGVEWRTPSGGGGTSSYTDLSNKPQINSVTLSGNKSLSDLGIASASDYESMNADEPLENLYVTQTLSDITDGQVLKNGTPQTQYGGGYYVSDYVAVTGGDTIDFNFIPWGTVDSGYRAAEYASDKTYIKNINTLPHTLSSNAAYIRFSVKRDVFGTSATANIALSYMNNNFVISNGDKEEFSEINGTGKVFLSNTVIPENATYYVDATNEEIIILSKMYGKDDKDVGFKMKSFIANDSFQFSSFGTVSNSAPFVTNKPSDYVQFMATSEDFFSPVIVYATANIDGDDTATGHFTGGMHKFNSLNTARRTSIDFYYDGRKKPYFAGYCNTIDIIITYQIQASNTIKNDGTGREVLKEIIALHFENGVMNVENTFIALESVNIGTIYFLQGCCKANGIGTNGVRYIGSDVNRGIYAISSNSNAGDKNARTIRMLSDTIQMDISVDDYDAGRFSHMDYVVYSADTRAFSGYSKCYFNVIRSENNMLHLDQNCSCTIKGSMRLGIFE